MGYSIAMAPLSTALRFRAARMAPALAGSLLLSGLAAAAGPLPPASGATAGTSQATSHLLKQSLRAATEAGSVRITVQFFSGSTTGKVVQDSGVSSGEQTVAIGKELASVVLVGGTAYISGNSEGLSSYFRLPSSVVANLVGKWASVQPTDASFGSVTGNVTLASALANVTPSGTLVAGKRTKVNGQRVRSISGEGPGGDGHVTLFVAANSRSLPVEAVESSGPGTNGNGEIVMFTRWGETLHLATPSGALPLSTLETVASGGN